MLALKEFVPLMTRGNNLTFAKNLKNLSGRRDRMTHATSRTPWFFIFFPLFFFWFFFASSEERSTVQYSSVEYIQYRSVGFAQFQQESPLLLFSTPRRNVTGVVVGSPVLHGMAINWARLSSTMLLTGCIIVDDKNANYEASVIHSGLTNVRRSDPPGHGGHPSRR